MLFTQTEIDEFFPTTEPVKVKKTAKEKNREHASKYRSKQHIIIKMLENKVLALRPNFELEPFLKRRSQPTLAGMDKKERNKIHAAAHRQRIADYIDYLKNTLRALER